MSRKEKKYHFIYKTTDTRNGKYYIGMHSTDNLNDGYVGSGNRIRKIKYRYGKEILKLEILEFLPNRKLLSDREAEIVNSELLNNNMCMNLHFGGEGGFSLEASKKGAAKKNFLLKNDIIWSNNYSKKVSDGLKQSYCNGIKKVCKSFKGKKHKNETIKKIKQSISGKQLGIKNSQFGTMWITNGEINCKLKNGEEIPLNWYKGRTTKIVDNYNNVLGL